MCSRVSRGGPVKFENKAVRRNDAPYETFHTNKLLDFFIETSNLIFYFARVIFRNFPAVSRNYGGTVAS